MSKSKDFNNLKAWFDKYLKLTNLPVYKLANRAGVSRVTIYAWMNDTYRPDSETLLRVVRVFAEQIGEDCNKLQAEALSQYTNRPEGRAPGYSPGPTELRVRR